MNPIEIINGKKNHKISLSERYIQLLQVFFLKKKISFQDFLLLLKHTTLKLISILYLPLAAILYIFGYKFLYISYWQIGTMALHVNYAIKDAINKKKNINKLIFLSPKSFGSNYALNKIYEKKIFLIKNNFYCMILVPFLELPFLTIYPLRYEYGCEKGKTFFINYKFNRLKNKIRYNFNKDEKILCKKILKNKEIKLKKKIVIINLRSNYPSSSNRSVNEKNYIPAFKYLLKKNYALLVYTDYKFKINNKFFNILKINDKYDQMIQAYLYSISNFCITTQSGPRFYPTLFEKPSFCTNVIPYDIMFSYNKKDLSLMQKIYRNNKLLKLDDIFFKYKISSFFGYKKKLKYLKNTSAEIKSGLLEFLKNLNNRNKNNDLENKIKMKYFLKDTEAYFGEGKISKQIKTLF